MRLSVSVMAHPARHAHVQRMLMRLGRPPGEVAVSWDALGSPTRSHDRVWVNTRSAWAMHDPEADWHLVLQDDAIVCPGLLEMLADGLEWVHPRAVVSLYLGDVRPAPTVWAGLARRADSAEAAWIVGPKMAWGLAVALPVPAIDSMLAAGDRLGGVPDDMRIGRWAHLTRHEAWYTWPSLVEHAEGESLIGHTVVRRARRFIGEAGPIEWNPAGPVVRR